MTEKKKITQKEIKTLKTNQGRSRGMMIKSLEGYIFEKKGKKGLEAIEKRAKDLGYPFFFKKISAFRWYPVDFVFAVLLITFEFFDWNKKEIFEIGYQAPITSLFSKLILRSFTSLEKAFKITARFWKGYTTSGDMKWTKYDLKKKFAVLKLSNSKSFKYPIIYEYMKGYLQRIMEITAKSKNVTVKVTKKMTNGDPFDEFTFTW